MKLKRLIFLIIGLISLALGCVGIVLPILPTVPFFLLTVFCFSQSSQRLHDWFIGTKMYKKHLEAFVNKKGMTVQTKIGIIIPVTLLMGFGFFMMAQKAIWIPCIILGIVWISHIIYFVFGVRTISAEAAEKEAELAEKYPYRKVLRVDEFHEDVAELMRVFSDTDHMQAQVDRKSKTITIHTDTLIDDAFLIGVLRDNGYTAVK